MKKAICAAVLTFLGLLAQCSAFDINDFDNDTPFGDLGVIWGRHPVSTGVQFRAYKLLTPVLNPYLGGSLMYSERFDGFYYGIHAGVEAMMPYRVSPFLGLGGSFHYEDETPADNDGKDNNGDGQVDESGESVAGKDYLSLDPRIGVRFWVTQKLAITPGATYSVTSLGRNRDEWFFELGLSFSFD
jgi:hypothetical protein